MISKLQAWGGVLTAIVGIFLVLFGILPLLMLPTSEPLIQWVLDPDWTLLNGLALVMTVLMPLALISLYAKQVEESGRLGLIGFVMAFVGSVLFASVQFDEALHGVFLPRRRQHFWTRVARCSRIQPFRESTW
jgi:drug/metabolite transporter (DMT)-like permease